MKTNVSLNIAELDLLLEALRTQTDLVDMDDDKYTAVGLLRGRLSSALGRLNYAQARRKIDA